MIVADLQRACCVPLTAVIQPLLPTPSTPSPDVHATVLTDDVARCAGCAAYINHLCGFERYGWSCSLCGVQNDYSNVANRRYAEGDEVRATFPELTNAIVDTLSTVYDTEDDFRGNTTAAAAAAEHLYSGPASQIVIALVDAAGTDAAHLDIVRSALLAAVEGLPSGALFGLIAFGGEGIALFEPSSKSSTASATSTATEGVRHHHHHHHHHHPCTVRHIPFTPLSMSSATAVELAHALPLDNLLLPVDSDNQKLAVCAAIEAVQLMPSEGKRPLGEALQAVLRYLGTTYDDDDDDGTSSIAGGGALGARLVVILGGPPNCGRGSIFKTPLLDDITTATEPRPLFQEHNASFLLDPYFPELTAWNHTPPPVPVPPPKPGELKNMKNNKNRNDWGWAEAAEPLISLTAAATELGLSSTDSDIISVQWETARRFYTEAGAAASALGIIVDVYAMSTTFVGLEMIQHVAEGSGGSVTLYENGVTLGSSNNNNSRVSTSAECLLPQDLYKRVSEAVVAVRGLMRLRTSPELRVAVTTTAAATTTNDKNKHNYTSSSRLRADPRYADLFHVACCHPHDTFAIELEYAKGYGGGGLRATPVLQLVFQYLTHTGTAAAAGEEEVLQRVLQRHTRIVTLAFPVARTGMEVFTGLNAEIYTFSLVQHLCGVAASEGVDAARTALLERTVELTTAFHEFSMLGEELPAHSSLRRRREVAAAPVDPSFTSCAAVQPLPRIAYALLRGKLFGGGSEVHTTATETTHHHHHPDTLCALRTLYDTLPPSELTTAIYPQLSSWSSPDLVSHPCHPLSRSSLAISRQPLYMLDAYDIMVVFYADQGHVAAGVHPPSFPPPNSSALRHHIAAITQARRLTPRVVVVREGEPGADQVFGQWLFEDERCVAAGGTFLDFLGQVKELVVELLQES